jgi:hypothetical protein
MLVGYFDDVNNYTAFNAVCALKNVSGEPEICDRDCDRLASLGVRYVNEDD